MSHFDAEFRAYVVRLYRQKQSTVKVARHLQIGSSSVWRILDREGVEMPARNSAEMYERMFRFKGKTAAAVVKAYNEGASMQGLCRKYRCSDQAIRNAVTRAGGSLRAMGGINRTRKWTDAQIQQICDFYEKGWTQAQLARRFHTTQTRISKLLIGAGVQPRKKWARLEDHGSWKGGRHILAGGYVGILLDRSDPLFCMARANHYVPEHRLVLARSLNRPLTKRESVHHINGNKQDNRLENLQLRQGKHGSGMISRCADCGSRNIVHERISDAMAVSPSSGA